MRSIYSVLARKQARPSHNAAWVEFTVSAVMWLEGQLCVCMCTHLATMSAHESWALISYFSAATCHQHSYQKYIPDHNHRRTGCQNTSEHMSTNERWERERGGRPVGDVTEKAEENGTKRWYRLNQIGEQLLNWFATWNNNRCFIMLQHSPKNRCLFYCCCHSW